MDNNIAILYLALFRLSIVSVGAISIILGYKLFVKGIFAAQGGEGAGLEARIGGVSITLSNSAPGAFFALFGVIIISVMLINSPPEITYRSGDNAAGSATANAGKTKTTRMTEEFRAESWAMRGNENTDDKLKLAADNKLRLAAELNDFAWNFHDSGKFKEAALYSRSAVYLAPDNPNFMDTLAEMLFKTQMYTEALTHKKKAAALNPKYKKDIQKFINAGR